MNNFTIDLMSNSSMKVFPQNTTSNFIVHLPKKIVLSGEWEVALSEIQIPNRFYNVSKNNNHVIFEEFKPKRWFEIEGAIYEIKEQSFDNIQKLIDAVNEGFEKILGQKIFEYDETTSKIKIKISTDPKVKKILHKNIYLENKLAVQLGFIPNDNILQYTESPYTVSLNYGLFDYIFIYCDIIESRIISDTYAQVLKIFTIENKSNEVTILSKEFQNLEYVPILKREFESIEINLRTVTGELMPFTHGISNLKLHFRRKQ